MIALDAGNSRIKWGIFADQSWQAQGALPTSDVGQLANIAQSWPTKTSIVGCNVAGEAVENAINAALASRFAPVHWLRSAPAECGVRNTYDDPQALGTDRWAALIGARHHSKNATLVVCAGTATTVDWLDSSGTFRGGVILPGFALMRTVLAQNTAQLPLVDGAFCQEPKNTADAIISGCLHAQVGAIERLFSQLAAEPRAHCLITGGAAKHISPLLRIPLTQQATLILDGLICVGQNAFAGSSL